MEMVKRIAEINPAHAETMQKRVTTFDAQPVPFWSKFKRVRATVELPHRLLLLAYADDGAQLIPLVDAARIYKVNALEALNLEPNQVVDYLKFFLSHAEPGRRLVESAADLNWLSSSTASDPARAAATAQVQPVKINDKGDTYLLTATILEGRQLLEATWEVQLRGGVKLKDSKLLVDGLPVPVTLD